MEFGIMEQVIFMKKMIASFIVLMIAFSASSCATTTAFANPNKDFCVPATNTDYYKCDFSWTSYFDTIIRLTVYPSSGDSMSLQEIRDSVSAILLQHHQLFDKYNAYEGINNIYAINQQADTPTPLKNNEYGLMQIDPILFEAIQFALTNEELVKAESVNLFSIALGPVLEIWHDLRDQTSCVDDFFFGSLVCDAPNPLLFNRTFAMDSSKIILDETTYSIAFAVPHMRLDVGGFAKGYAAEVVTDFLDDLNIPYIFNAGSSNVKAGGVNPQTLDGFYNVALTQPIIGFSLSQPFYGIVKVGEGVSIVTSGNYQRYFIGSQDGKVYHHIIDPRTFFPGGDTMSVSVLHEDGGLADIYSTAVYLLGLEAGLAFVNNTPGLEAIWYLNDDTIQVSNGITVGTFTFNNQSYPQYTLK
jgi:FAD:protein FMN transferase